MERINCKLKRRVLGNMFLLDKVFIIFIAREHDSGKRETQLDQSTEQRGLVGT